MPLTFHSGDAAIAALITPPGTGGVAIVRLSGAGSLDIAQKICSRALRECLSHRLYRCGFKDKRPIDEGLVVVMLAPHSFTGELTVEFHLHGSPFIAHLILRALVDSGAELALPGEFSYRALCHGKLDLTQVEAINDLINAKGQSALRAAHHQLTGELSKCIGTLKEQLVEIAAQLEASIDFPDEGLPIASFDALISRIGQLVKKMQKLSDSYRQGLIARKGLTLCLLGRPNVGKSSLLNALVQKERAIVTAQAGTTRDVLREPLQIAGHLVHLLDTAGIRPESHDEIEIEGMRRTWEAVREADLILLVLAAPDGWTVEDLEILKSIECDQMLIVWNKVDLAPAPSALDEMAPDCQIDQRAFKMVKSLPQIAVSASRQLGFDQFEQALNKAAERAIPLDQNEVILTSQRHWHLINDAICALKRACGHECELSFDLIAHDVRCALLFLQKLLGGDIAEDVLSTIFSTFCLGK